MAIQIIESVETLYDKYCQDHDEVHREAFDRTLEELRSEGYIIDVIHEDQIFIRAKQNLKWSDFHH